MVQVGDSLYGLAARYHADWREIARRNHLPSSLVVMLGQRLRIPVKVTVTTAKPATTAPHYPAAVTQAAARHRAALTRASVPDRWAVRAMVKDTAKRYGVDPALALAVAYQESGFQQRVVSPADAVGVMQVVPSTGRWVSTYVVGRPLNLLSARDNIIAGVALLRVLTRSAKVDQAVAGYYQGLASVRQRGMYSDTKRYVANVLSLRTYFRAHP